MQFNTDNIFASSSRGVWHHFGVSHFYMFLRNQTFYSNTFYSKIVGVTSSEDIRLNQNIGVKLYEVDREVHDNYKKLIYICWVG